jgi:hypothetical protein
MKHPVEEGIVLGGESFTHQLEFEARRQKHFTNVVCRSLRFTLRDELREPEVGCVEVDPSGCRPE